MGDVYLDADGACRKLSVSKATLHRLRRAGAIRTYLALGAKLPRFSEADLDAYMAAGRGYGGHDRRQGDGHATEPTPPA